MHYVKNHMKNTGLLGALPVCVLIWDVILHEFRLRKFLPLNFLEFVGNGIGIPM